MLLVPLLFGACLTQERAAQAAPRSYGDLVQSAYEHVEKGELDAARKDLDATELGARGFEWSFVGLRLALALEHTAAQGLELRGRGRAAPSAPRFEAVSRIVGSGGALYAIALSPDGEFVAAGGDEHEVRVWSTRTGAPHLLLTAHAGAITGLAWSRDGLRLASASKDGNVCLWDLRDGRAQRTFRATGEALTALAWDPTDEFLVAADTTRAVRVWDISNSEPRLAVRGHAGKITGLSFSPDGKLCASASEDGSVRIFDPRTGDLRRLFGGDGTPCQAIAFEPDALALRVAILNGSVRRFDIQLGRRTDTTAPVSEPFWCQAVSADGTRIATGSELGFVRLFDRASQAVLALQVSLQPIHAIAFDARTTRLYACGAERSVFVLETDAERARLLQREDPSQLPDDDTAATMRPLDVEALCRRVVERAGLAPEAYLRAEALARSVSPRIFDSGQVQTTIAGAIYRLERLDEALALLTEAGEKRRGWPSNLAFRAMTLARLGRVEEARAMLTRLETLLEEPRWSKDVDARAMLEEARAVVLAANAPPRK